jgi:multidrug efflux pump subunit AcrA (membrane-fusion protein)
MKKRTHWLFRARALRKKDDQYFVYLVHPEDNPSAGVEAAAENGDKPETVTATNGEPQSAYGIVEIRPIEITYATPDAIEIKEGLEEGDLVIVDVQQDLEERARVEITETQEGIF